MRMQEKAVLLFEKERQSYYNVVLDGENLIIVNDLDILEYSSVKKVMENRLNAAIIDRENAWL